MRIEYGRNWDKNKIISGVSELLADKDVYDRMSRSVNPYGDGRACQRICVALERELISLEEK